VAVQNSIQLIKFQLSSKDKKVSNQESNLLLIKHTYHQAVE